MKMNNFAMRYELLLELYPNYFDDYSDPDQRMDVFLHESIPSPVERFFDVAQAVLAH